MNSYLVHRIGYSDWCFFKYSSNKLFAITIILTTSVNLGKYKSRHDNEFKILLKLVFNKYRILACMSGFGWTSSISKIFDLLEVLVQ